MALRVVCLNWNNYLGRGEEYVGKMRNMVERHLTIPHEFIEVTEKDLPEGREGWWNKLYLFEMFDSALYLDLDVILTSNIDHIIEGTDPGRLWMRDDFSYSMIRPKSGLGPAMLKTLGGVGTCQSSVMVWHEPVELSPTKEMLDECHGDQNVITACLWPNIGLLPEDEIKSYKYHPGELAPIVCFHGSPKPHEVRDPWVIDHWQ